ncbi:hypothetical protein HS041_12100 [Planomonospora sp. ID67723]|uniref:hypothetical protein n=1 Tax=Planomonospora sp. ID67723 TaxID=2738134 RepID=UPI0018C3940B|nr:hypothetical protein [Planomonospora sp. ID67723]MBG0828510.1 hypothetical protein [Planomonospora sp. ID67723]
MSPDAPAPPSLRDAVTELVAREFAGHREHQLERFAADASRTLLSMRPAVHDEVTQAVAATLESSARVVRMLAGLGEEAPLG